MAEVSDYVVRLEKAGPEAVGFFYYSGHGAANSKYGENYLIPVAAPIVSDTQLPIMGVKLGEIVDAIGATSAKANFLVFDACRNVPISFSAKSPDKGFRPVDKRRNMLIAFATDPGKTATDEGVYAEALAEEMQKPGVLATEVFRAVRGRVLKATENRQFPWIEDGLIENMYFKAPAATPAPTPQTALVAPPKPPVPSSQQAPATDCDLYAAAPYDPERRAPGVEDKKIDVAKALPACRAASEAYPQEGRFRYQLARTFFAAKDFGKAKEIFVDMGNTNAMTSFAFMYMNGEGVAQDKAEAARLFRKAADLGSEGAMTSLAEMYRNGEGVALDKAEAFSLYRKAARSEDNLAIYRLAEMYDKGESVAQDPGRAAELVVRAIKKQNIFTVPFAPFGGWSEAFRKELQQLLKKEGVYKGSIDGKASEALRSAVLALAAKSKGGG